MKAGRVPHERVEKALTAAQKHAYAACGRAAVAVPQSIQMLQHSAGDAAVAILLSARSEFERQAVAAMVVQRNGGGGKGDTAGSPSALRSDVANALVLFSHARELATGDPRTSRPRKKSSLAYVCGCGRSANLVGSPRSTAIAAAPIRSLKCLSAVPSTPPRTRKCAS
jgi:hypothetical protein